MNDEQIIDLFFKRSFQNQFGIKVEVLNLCVKTAGFRGEFQNDIVITVDPVGIKQFITVNPEGTLDFRIVDDFHRSAQADTDESVLVYKIDTGFGVPAIAVYFGGVVDG